MAASELGYDGELYMLAFDHRHIFRDEPRAAEAKRVVYEGFLRGAAGGIPQQKAGLLDDEEFGAEIARDALARGVAVGMPVERSGQDEFQFEFGDAWREHLAEFDPHFAKVLVRWGSGGRDLDRRQAARLAERASRSGGHSGPKRCAASSRASSTVTRLPSRSGKTTSAWPRPTRRAT